MKRRFVWIALFGLAPVLFPALPVKGADRPSLASIVPEEVHFFVNWQNTEEREQLLKPYLRAFKRLVDSGIGKDIFELATMEMSQGQREQALHWIGQIFSLLKTPNWKALLGGEGALAFRISVPIPEYVVLFRVTEQTAGERQAEFRKLFSSIAQFAPGTLAVTDTTRLGAKISRLELAGVPFALVAASKKDMVALSTSDFLLDGVLGLMDSKDGSGSIAKAGRFTSGFQGLAEPEDSQVFFDLPGYLGFIKGMMGMASGSVQDDKIRGIISIAGVILDELARIGPITSVELTEGKRMFTDSKIPFSQKDSTGFFEELIRDQKPLPDEYARVVPADAVAFHMSCGLDPLKLYDAVTGLVKERMPNGEELLNIWAYIQQQVGFNLREDLFSWMTGGGAWVAFPVNGKVESVSFLALRDNQKAQEVILKGLGKLRNFLNSRGQRVRSVTAPELGESFKVLRIEAFPWFQPVIGFPEGLLVVGSSPRAVQKVMATYRGEAPGIADNPNFKAMKVPQRPLAEIFYFDVENSLGCLADLIGGVGFVASILPKDRHTRPALKLGAILTKLAIFIREVDLVADYGGWTYYDGEKHSLFSRQMVRLKASEESF